MGQQTIVIVAVKRDKQTVILILVREERVVNAAPMSRAA